MHTPGFTAERALAVAHGRYQAAGSAPPADPAAVTPALRPQYITIDDTLFYCYPCMSGGPVPGSLVTACCDAIATVAAGMSGG